jgi:hypothetical protein
LAWRSGQTSAPAVTTPRKPALNFARTKIQAPRARPGALLPRPALQDRLVQALGTLASVLVCATAGFGKTSALTQFDLPWRAAPGALISAALSGQGNEQAQRKALRAMVTELTNALDAAETHR